MESVNEIRILIFKQSYFEEVDKMKNVKLENITQPITKGKQETSCLLGEGIILSAIVNINTLKYSTIIPENLHWAQVFL